MGSLLPIAGAVQWLSGLALATIALRRAHRYERTGQVPRLFARLSIGLFILAALELSLTIDPIYRRVGAWMPKDFGGNEWQLRTLIVLCVAGWTVLAISAVWSGILGVGVRRRAAAAELRRRTDRALAQSPRRTGLGRDPGEMDAGRPVAADAVMPPSPAGPSSVQNPRSLPLDRSVAAREHRAPPPPRP